MKKVDIFSPFIYHFSMKEHFIIRDAYLNLILENYNHDPNFSNDWNVHTDFHDKNLPHQIDWWTSVQYYKQYVNEFIFDYFRGLQLDWRIDDNPWYTVYGKGQKADQHEHMACDFSAVHFLKFNPEVHNPIKFIHPEFTKTKYLTKFKPFLVNNLGTCDKQSYYKEHYVPEINEGDFIIFPSELQHLVDKSLSDEPRITIAFNFSLKQ